MDKFTGIWKKSRRISIKAKWNIKRKSELYIRRLNECNTKYKKVLQWTSKSYLIDNDYPKIVSDAKYKLMNGQGLKTLTPKQMFQRIQVALAQVKAGDTSEKLLNDIRKSYILCIDQKNY